MFIRNCLLKYRRYFCQTLYKQLKKIFSFKFQPSSVPSLVPLNVHHESFCKDLEILDNTPSRTCDTCHVFYVKDGQTNFKDILNNVVILLNLFNTVLLYNKYYFYALNIFRLPTQQFHQTF